MPLSLSREGIIGREGIIKLEDESTLLFSGMNSMNSVLFL
jgi:hypothetical protein